MYPSPPSSSARKVSSTFPSTSTVYAPAVSVRAARTAVSRPIRPMTSLATPRASTACPPGRRSGARSTTVTSAPRRCSQWARAGPAMLAPDTNTLVLLTAPPAHPSRSRTGSSDLPKWWARRSRRAGDVFQCTERHRLKRVGSGAGQRLHVPDAEVEDSVPAVAGHQVANTDPVRIRRRHHNQRLALAQAFVVQVDDLGLVAPALEELEDSLPDPVRLGVENTSAVGAVQDADEVRLDAPPRRGRHDRYAVPAAWDEPRDRLRRAKPENLDILLRPGHDTPSCGP